MLRFGFCARWLRTHPSSVLQRGELCALRAERSRRTAALLIVAALRARGRALAEPLRLRSAPTRPSSLRFARVGAPCALSRSRRGSLRSLRLRALGALRSRRRSSLCFGGSRGSFAWRAARLRPLGRLPIRMGAASGIASRFASRLTMWVLRVPSFCNPTLPPHEGFCKFHRF